MKYFAGEMFGEKNDFFHHWHKNKKQDDDNILGSYNPPGKPHTYLTNKDNKIIKMDADLFFPLKKGMIIINYYSGVMYSYSYVVENNNEITEVKKLPYGTLKHIKNEFSCPNNVFKFALENYLNKGTKTWFFWKALMNSKAVHLNNDYLFDTLTGKQERIPNAGMIIYGMQPERLKQEQWDL